MRLQGRARRDTVRSVVNTKASKAVAAGAPLTTVRASAADTWTRRLAACFEIGETARTSRRPVVIEVAHGYARHPECARAVGRP